jgi:1-acyl-sn-glycerol-3-phosphate acyltransferase
MQVRAGAPVPLEDLYDQAMTRQVLARATARIMRAIAAELQVLRGGTPPEELWDPRQHGQSTMGRPHQRPHHQRPHRRHPSREDPA